MKQELHLRHC